MSAEIGLPQVIPTAGRWPRLRFYIARYGLLRAASRYFFCHGVPSIWPLAGTFVTTPFLRRWIGGPGAKILNLGGGGNLLTGCLTLDISPAADCYADLRKPLPFGAESVDAIFCEEFVEHITKEEAGRFLRECLRILKRGGVMRITTPDLNYLITTLGDDAASCDRFNEMVYDCGHKHLYSRGGLERLAHDAGFAECRRSSYRDPTSRLGHLDSHADRVPHEPELSQYVELVK